jgi:hypothetical protein
MRASISYHRRNEGKIENRMRSFGAHLVFQRRRDPVHFAQDLGKLATLDEVSNNIPRR